MVCLIVSDLNVAERVLNVYERNWSKFIGIELEYGLRNLNETNSKLIYSFNHHNSTPKDLRRIPCESYKFEEIIEKQTGNKPKDCNFLISHIDLDVVFCMGWLTGIFPKTKKFFDYATKVKKFDSGDKSELLNDKIFNSISLAINRAKNRVIFNGSSIANVSEIMRFTLRVIKNIINKDIVYNKPHESILVVKPFLKTKLVNYYAKKTSENYIDGNKFIVVWNYTLSVYGNVEFCKKHNINLCDIIIEYFGDRAGGTNFAVGSPRNVKISREEFYKFKRFFETKIKDIKYVRN